jgi:hypothetical protein
MAEETSMLKQKMLMREDYKHLYTPHDEEYIANIQRYIEQEEIMNKRLEELL